MEFAVRLAARIGTAGVCAALVGCGFAQKPYAGDPLLRGGRAVWWTSDVPPPVPPATGPLPVPPPEPAPPTSSRWE
ncbi:hypothetical protein FTUN_7885 [Frigoriglobus tundricola]|uniref:Uncharacterized protein n=1 Tax=Frigoriglobus tundricola TaxID=2774151 RepID=A0A6M5Z1M3_9BACT|nr:hypothetical protein FTUN_7885 [Frigoriglobus tundricola]